MRHYPLFADFENKRVVVSGAGPTAVAKLRLLIKTVAKLEVYGQDPDPQILAWAQADRIKYCNWEVTAHDLEGCFVLYCANDEDELDRAVARLGRQSGALVNVVDNLEASDFITPAIVDRDPVTVAIGTEGAAPVLARKIKADLEKSLPGRLGGLARLASGLRDRIAGHSSGQRRQIWQQFFFGSGLKAFEAGGADAAETHFSALAAETPAGAEKTGSVVLVGAGPGNPELLTLKAAEALRFADVVIHDRLISSEILELARREAIVIETGKTGFGRSWRQEAINQLMIEHAETGAQVVRLKSGDTAIFARLDEEIDALEAAGIDWEIIPGITTASAAAAKIGQSLTKRNRNSSVKLLTGHDIDGFADHEWRDLAKSGSVAAIYMGIRAAKFLRGRLLMHGAHGDTPVTIIENLSREDEKVIPTTLLALPESLFDHSVHGPAILMYGLEPRQANAAQLRQDLQQFNQTGA